MLYQKILVPMALDHDISPRTLEIAQALSAPGAQIIALHVYEMPAGMANVYIDEETLEAAYAAARARLAEKTAGIAGLTPVITQGHSARTIIDYAHAHGIDCIVMGSHKPGLSDYFLGSTAARVVRHAPCAVHVQRSPV